MTDRQTTTAKKGRLLSLQYSGRPNKNLQDSYEYFWTAAAVLIAIPVSVK